MVDEENAEELDAPELLYRAEDEIEAALYLQALESAGIRSQLTGGQGSLSFGALGADALRVDVYVGEDDLAAGRRVIEEYQAKKAKDGVPSDAWTCSSCGEQSDGNFERCWKCGVARPQPAS